MARAIPCNLEKVSLNVLSKTPEVENDLQELHASHWDVVVIGAGLAGSLSALSASKSGMKVLLVDAKPLGRKKVCGGCLNQSAWNVLEQFELTDAIRTAGSQSLDSINLVCGGNRARWPMPVMHSISRASLDTILIDRAVQNGTKFVARTSATVETHHHAAHRKVRLSSVGVKTNSPLQVEASVVIAADGLGHPSLARLPEFQAKASESSRIGIGATFSNERELFPSDELTMVVGKHGYVGIARVENNLLNVAAAVDRNFLSGANRRPGDCVSEMLRKAGVGVPDGLTEAEWTGTPPLTRQSLQVAGHRVMLVGDAAGYVEPFTGEGMAWALKSASLAVPIARRAVEKQSAAWSTENERQWQSIWKSNIRRQQFRCRVLARLLRMPRLTRLSLPVIARIPNVPAKLFPSPVSNSCDH